MTPTEISDLVYAVVGVLGALTIWLRVQAAHKQITNLKSQVSGLKTQSAAAAANIDQLQQEQAPKA